MSYSFPPSTLNSDEIIHQSRRFPQSSVRILKAWFITHSPNPHPTEAEKQVLQDQTGLSVQQISNWFANARRRRRGANHKPRPASPSIPDLYYHSSPQLRDSTSAPISIPTPSVDHTQTWPNMNPFERWRNSPPEDEAAPISAIVSAVADSNTHRTIAGSAPDTHTLNSFVKNATRTLSETSFESTSSFWTTSASSSSAQSARSDALSATSNISSRSIKIRRSRARVRRDSGRRLPLPSTTIKNFKSQNDKQSRLFQCTFCTDTFKTKYDWTRHEGSLHLVLERWTCTPHGPVYLDETVRRLQCAFCDEPDPSELHTLTHDHHSCSEKSPAQRSFRRKDHLRQHLRLIHRVQEAPSTMARWKTTISHVACRCGFCGERFTSWHDRNEHLADHFRDGKKMKDWKGDRGFEPSVCILVENAMPPYLIATEANEFEPFSASRNNGGDDLIDDHHVAAAGPKQPTSFEDLTLRLVAYVRAAIDSGTLITDEIVRRQARLIMFGDDDAWNQTPADNAQWLSLFKNGLGLGGRNTTATTTTHQSNGNTWTSQPAMTTTIASTPFQQPHIPVSTSQPEQNVVTSPVTFNSATSRSPRPGLPTAFWNLSAIPAPFRTPECLAEFKHMEETGQSPFMPDPDFHYQYRSPEVTQTIDDLLADVQRFSENDATRMDLGSTNSGFGNGQTGPNPRGWGSCLDDGMGSEAWSLVPDDLDLQINFATPVDEGFVERE